MSTAAIALRAPWSATVGGHSAAPMTAEQASERLPRLPRAGLSRGRREAALVREAQRGSNEALEELFRRHWRRAHRAAFLVVGDAAAAEDIAQESFLAAVRALDRFDRRRPFGPWLHRITVNRAIDFARARKLRRESVLPETTEGTPPTEAGFSDELTAALSELSPEHRAVIVLRYLLGYTPGEIGEILGLPRGTVNSRMRRALDRLRPVVEGEEG
jgi:RNA polymerase sigma-70 factor, ECF subfamily